MSTSVIVYSLQTSWRLGGGGCDPITINTFKLVSIYFTPTLLNLAMDILFADLQVAFLMDV